MTVRALMKGPPFFASHCANTRLRHLPPLGCPGPANQRSMGNSCTQKPNTSLIPDRCSGQSHVLSRQRDCVVPSQRLQLSPSRIGDRHSVVLAGGTHRQFRLTRKEHGFHPFGREAVRHRGALRLDLSPKSLQVGETADVDRQDERTIYSARAVIARGIHLRQAATNELSKQAESAPFVPTKGE